jgi:hypothetical protein
MNENMEHHINLACLRPNSSRWRAAAVLLRKQYVNQETSAKSRQIVDSAGIVLATSKFQVTTTTRPSTQPTHHHSPEMPTSSIVSITRGFYFS